MSGAPYHQAGTDHGEPLAQSDATRHRMAAAQGSSDLLRGLNRYYANREKRLAKEAAHG